MHMQCWSRSTNSFYVGANISGRKAITPYLDIEDDPMQMAGDVLLDNMNGNIVKKYLSQFPADRPNLDFMDFHKN